MPTVCFVTCLKWPEMSASDRLVAEALSRRGIAVVGQPWNAPEAAFDRYDAVILRSNWDYHFAPDAFLVWLGRWESAGVNLWNPPALVRWNLSKRYLLDLDAAGVAIVPTVVTDAGGLPGVLDARGWDAAVIKPAIGASAHGTAVVRRTEVRAHTRELLAQADDRELLVQPFLEEIRSAGEWSLVLIDGRVTHAVLKRPAAGDFRVQSRFGGTVEVATPPAVPLAAARQAVAALPAPPLYARVDGVVTRAGFLLMEVEVNEPGLFFVQRPDAAASFADAIHRRLNGHG